MTNQNQPLQIEGWDLWQRNEKMMESSLFRKFGRRGVPLRLAGLRCIEPSCQTPAPLFFPKIAPWFPGLRFVAWVAYDESERKNFS
jgi:hypothetical protein